MQLRTEFFTASAQLIPLLVVAAAIDTRAWASQARQRPSDVAFDVITLFMLTLAWMASMFVIATGTVTALDEVLVALGLAVGWIQIVGSIALHQTERLGRAKVTKRLRFWILLLISTPLLGAAAVWFAAY
jgi:hypothetical protein